LFLGGTSPQVELDLEVPSKSPRESEDLGLGSYFLAEPTFLIANFWWANIEKFPNSWNPCFKKGS